MFYVLNPVSSNSKTGPMPVSTSNSSTCPDACPIKVKGCYAKYGPVGMHWRKLDKGESKNAANWAEFLTQIKRIQRGSLWRHNQAGDLNGSNNEIDGLALRQPIIANLRTVEPGGAGIEGRRMESEGETACFKVYLGQRDLLYVIDGQHRRYAMDLVFEFLTEIRLNRKYPRKPKLFEGDFKATIENDILAAWDECDEVARGFCKIAVEIHLGLGVREEQQLFHDLNNLSKKVERSLALKFDSANPVNQFIQNELLPNILDWEDVVDGDQSNWQKDTGRWTFRDLAAVNAILFLNKTSIASATPKDVEEKQATAYRMWGAIANVPGFGKQGAKANTVLAQPVVVKAIAKLVYDLGFGRRRDASAAEDLEKLLHNLSQVNFSHTNPVWRFYELTEQERIKAKLTGLRDYLPDNGDVSRDIGHYDTTNKWMKFGTRHNDIYPIIADMIRWQLKLPSRTAPKVEDAA